MSLKLVKTSHRHCVFTIPEELRIYFRKDRSLLNCLFHAVRDVILYMFRKLNKTENFTPGFICVLHSFGRDLKWNPHIHVLLSEGGMGNIMPWRVVKHFNYTFLRNSFRMVLLNLMEKHIGNPFKKVKAYIYKNCPNGFYVYAKPNLTNTKEVAKYIGRYLGRPVIATSRIIDYDGENVSFRFNRHEDNKLIVKKITAVEFIKKLIIHIPDKHFKMIRYYGVYAKKHKQAHLIFLAVHKNHHANHRLLANWRWQMHDAFGLDPLCCSKCNSRLTLIELFHKKAPLSEIHSRKFAVFDNFATSNRLSSIL